MKLVHHHLILQAKVGILPNSLKEENLRKFMLRLIDITGMKILIKPLFKLSTQRAWTGIMGIVTSHIAFHYWIDEKYLQLDIYSCKNFDRRKAIEFITRFWKAREVKAMFINREVGKDFKIERIGF